MDDFLISSAYIQGDYRYSLTRVWDETKETVTFVLLNPSTADGVTLDPTLRRCVKFATQEAFGGMVVLNLYAYRTPKPKLLFAAADPVGPHNDDELAAATGRVIVGWGASARPDRVRHVLQLLPPRLFALKLTGAGHPHHPLYLPAHSRLIPYR